MNQTHIHLLITHLPIIGAMLGALVLAYGIWKKSNPTLVAAYNVLILSAIGACIGYMTGEGAEEAVEHMQGVSERVIEAHEESAQVSLIALAVVATLAFLGIYLTQVKSRLTRRIAVCTLTASIVGFALVARTGYLGGKIRHAEEIGIKASPVKEGNEKDND